MEYLNIAHIYKRFTLQRITSIRTNPHQFRTELFCFITQRLVVIPYRPLGTTCRPNVSRFLTLEDGTDRLSRNVGNKLQLVAA